MPTKIKHSAITSQTDLHEPKLHTTSHKYNGVDPIVIEDDYTYELSTKKILQPNASNRALWTDALTVNTIVADTTIISGTGITATTGNIAASSGNLSASGTVTAGTNITATNGDIEATAADKGLFLGGNGVDGTYEMRRHQEAGVNFPLLTRRVGGTYLARPHQFAVMHSSTVIFNADSDQGSICYAGGVSNLNDQIPIVDTIFTTSGSPTWSLGTTVSGVNYAQIRSAMGLHQPWPMIVPFDCYVYTTCGMYRTAGTGTASVYMMKADCNTTTADITVVGNSSVATTTNDEFRYKTGVIESVTGDEASLADNTTLDKSKVLEGQVLFPLFYATTTTLAGQFYFNVEMIPCN